MISQKIKQRIIELAVTEGKLELEGNKLKGGEKIEKYLAPFRSLFILNTILYI